MVQRHTSSLERHYPPNPAYGTGVFRRRLRMAADGRWVRVAVNDPYHAMWAALDLKDGVVADVRAGMWRTPKNVCPGAVHALRELMSMDIQRASASIFSEGRAGRNCTHLLDITRFGLGCHVRGEVMRVLDLIIPDPDARGQSRIRAEADGVTIHDWELVDGRLTDAAGFVGSPLDSSFASAMRERFDGIELEAAWALRMAVFVAVGRAYITDGPNPVRALDETDRHGDCFAFSAPLLPGCIDNIGYVQNFTDGLTELLPPDFPRLEGSADG